MASLNLTATYGNDTLNSIFLDSCRPVSFEIDSSATFRDLLNTLETEVQVDLGAFDVFFETPKGEICSSDVREDTTIKYLNICDGCQFVFRNKPSELDEEENEEVYINEDGELLIDMEEEDSGPDLTKDLEPETEPVVKTHLSPEETLLMGAQNVLQDRPSFMETQREPDITVVEVDLPPPAQSKFAIVLENVFSREECAELVEWTENQLEWSPAMLNIGGGNQVLDLDNRKHDRAIYDTKFISSYIFERIKKYLPKQSGDIRGGFRNHTLSCLNERLRFLRYTGGEYFAPHYDGSYCRPDGSERSAITVLFYMNEEFEGGMTSFLGENQSDNWFQHQFMKYPVKPKTGSVLLFQHDIFHEGSTLISGRKYLMRTDVMYRYESKRKKKRTKIQYR